VHGQKRQFYQIVDHFHKLEPAEPKNQRVTTYSRPLLIRYTYEYARSQESRDVFLRSFSRSMGLSLDADDGSQEENRLDLDSRQVEGLRSVFFAFADYLLDNFFLPCKRIPFFTSILEISKCDQRTNEDCVDHVLVKASTKKTPQPSPAYHSAVLRAQGSGLPQGLVGTPERVSALRGACLVRDRHRCVVSRGFDIAESVKRFERDGDDARDNDGLFLIEEEIDFQTLEVAHILPHSLVKANPCAQLVSRILPLCHIRLQFYPAQCL